MLGGLHCCELQCIKMFFSKVKMILFSPEKLKLWNISSAWLLSLIYEGRDLTMGVMALSK